MQQVWIYVWSVLIYASMASAAARPNIIYVLCDDLGYGDVQCLNPVHGKIKTPCADRLAREGMIFADAHSGSSVCTPTRYGILTGRYAWRTRLQKGVLSGSSAPLIAPERLAVPALLRQQGYATAMVGKWHLGMDLPFVAPAPEDKDTLRKVHPEQYDASRPIVNGPADCGFDTFFGISASLDMPPFAYIRNRYFTQPLTITNSWLRSGAAAPDFEAVDVLPTLTREAVRVIEQQAQKKRPFFLYVALNAPHTPILPSARWKGKSGLGDYGDFVMETDWALGELVAATERTGIANNTLVIFTSDNGCSPAAGIQRLQAAGHMPNGAFRGAKADIWEGGHRIPFIAKWPGVVKPGSVTSNLVCLTDLMATCADVLGLALPDHVGEDSVSILPLLKGQATPVRQSVIHHSINGAFAIRTLQWKLELCPGSGGWSTPTDQQARAQKYAAWQLYDVSIDAAETNNLIAARADVVEALRKELQACVTRGRSTPGALQANDVEVLLDASNAP